jgi:hypothetical protein
MKRAQFTTSSKGKMNGNLLSHIVPMTAARPQAEMEARGPASFVQRTS